MPARPTVEFDKPTQESPHAQLRRLAQQANGGKVRLLLYMRTRDREKGESVMLKGISCSFRMPASELTKVLNIEPYLQAAIKRMVAGLPPEPSR